MYVSFNSDTRVTNELEIDKAVEELKRVIQGSLLVDTFDFELTLSFHANEYIKGEDGEQGESRDHRAGRTRY